jgi:formamidopyrimidine-DNA glycosylase
MPELPEVETIRMQLDRVLPDLTVTGIEVLKEKSFQGGKAEVVGQKIKAVERRAKMILIRLANKKTMVVHLKMTGQLIYRKNNKNQISNIKNEEEKTGRYDVDNLPNKYTRVIVTFSNGAKLFFNDLRIFGWIKLIDGDKLPMEKLGPEALGPDFNLSYFERVLAKTSRSIKLVILDQEKVAGVGNIYANEALFEAGIDPRRSANKLKKEEIKKLRMAIIDVLQEAIKHKGTSDRDEAFRQIDGEKGSHQNFLRVYGRAKEKCPRCGGEIQRINIGGRGTFFCAGCQH